MRGETDGSRVQHAEPRFGQAAKGQGCHIDKPCSITPPLPDLATPSFTEYLALGVTTVTTVNRTRALAETLAEKCGSSSSDRVNTSVCYSTLAVLNCSM